MAKNNLIMNNEWSKVFTGLPDEKAGQLVKAVFAIHEGNDVQMDDPILSAVLDMIGAVVIERKERYEEICRKNAENGRKGGEAKSNNDKQNAATVNERKRNVATASESKRDVANKIKTKVKVKEKDKNIYTPEPPLMVAVRDVVDHLNKTAGTHYFASSRVTVEKIQARLREGFSVDDCKKVIDIKTAEWKGTDMAKYLRPETLFGSKFESYLNQPPEKRGGTKFQNFTSRQDQDHDDMVSKIIAMQTGG